MKKAGIITVLTIIIAVFLFVFPHNKIPVSIKRYYMKNKLFGQGGYLRSWIQSDDPAIIDIANKLKAEDEQTSIINAYNWLEKNYHYVPDSDISFSDGRITIRENTDYWQKPLLTLSIIQQTGGFYGDCEDGTFLLTSILNAMGYHDIYAEIGTVSLQSGIYGHAWVVWHKDGRYYLLETTLGTPLQQIRVLPSFYSPQFMFNDVEIKQFYSGTLRNVPMLTPKAREELIERLNGNN